MKLKINGEFVDYSLEQETNLEQVLQSLQKEINKDNQQILSVYLDGQAVDLDKTASYSLKNVELIEVNAVSTQQLLIDSLIEISNYLHRVINFVEGKKITEILPEERKNLQEGVDWLTDMVSILVHNIPDIERMVFTSNAESELSWLKEKYSEIFNNQESFVNFFDYLRTMVFRFDSVINALKEKNLSDDELVSRLSQFIDLIPSIKESLAKVSEMMHRGRDGDAFQVVDQVVSELKNYLQLIPVLAQSGISQGVQLSVGTWIEVNTNLNEQLSMLVDAMENNDSVTIGDICDYELPEQLDNIVEAVKLFRSRYN